MKQKVYDYLKTIPKGKVVTYGQIAEYLCNKNLSRVVGNILHINPEPINQPCYKVVNQKGELSKISKEIHENTLNALINSEKCAETFWNNYKVKEPKYVWGTTKNYNDHENREVGSLSRWLVNKYEQRTMNKIIGSDEDCNGLIEASLEK